MDRRRFLISGSSALIALQAPGVGAAAESLDEPLRDIAAKRKLRFGAAFDPQDIDRADMVALYRRQCSSLTPRNQLKWTAVQRARGQFDFAVADQMVEFARSIDCGIYGHTLVWYRVPNWVAAITDKAELRSVMRRHITQTVRHFGDGVYAWDVVNEPLEYDDPALRPSIFQQLLGEDHIREALEIAREANPNAHLVVNECHLEKAGAVFDARRALMLQLVERLRKAGAPLDAIGLQAHFRPGLDSLDFEALASFCRALKAMDVGLYITELDASCRFVHRLRSSPEAAYAKVFGDVVRAAGAGNLLGVTTWGLAEKYAEPETGGGEGCPTRILLYDDRMEPRPTFQALRSALDS